MLSLFAPLQSCLVCGSLAIRRPPLCTFCNSALHSLMPQQKICRIHEGLRFQSLFLWSSGGPRVFHKLAYQLKMSETGDWRIFAEWLLERADLPSGAVIVPAPPRVWGHQDHAWSWARALSDTSGLPLRSPLMRVNTPPQKQLGRYARSQIRIDVADPEWNCSDYKSVIIVDDVVTTGSTAKASNIALGQPKGSIVWTLFDRTPCDAPSALI